MITAPSSAPAIESRIAPNTEEAVDLERYVPAFFTWIANKLARGASQAYLKRFGVGIETWRLLVLLTTEQTASAQDASRIIGMDKGSVSRAFKSMQAAGLIVMTLDANDGRLRMATLTRKGAALHEQIVRVALERERAFLAVLDDDEKDTLLALLRRLHDNLPAVDVATERYLNQVIDTPATSTAKRKRGAR